MASRRVNTAGGGRLTRLVDPNPQPAAWDEATCPDPELLAAYIDDPARRHIPLERHLCECDACRQLVIDLRLGRSGGAESTGRSSDEDPHDLQFFDASSNAPVS